MNNVKYHIVLFLLRCVAFMPLRVLYVLSDCLAFFARRILRYRLRVVRKNLRAAFPDECERRLKEIEKKFYANLCDYMVETIKLLHISDAELRRRVTLSGTSLVNCYADLGHPVFLFLGHYGNWEWVPAITLSLSNPAVMGALYKPLRSKLMDRIMITVRGRFSSVNIKYKSAYRALIKLKKDYQSFMIGFIADQRPLGKALNHWIEFMGLPTAVMTGAETIGSHVDAKYVYLHIERPRRGYYSLTFCEMTPDSSSDDFPYTRRFFEMLQDDIRRKPDLWLWSHNRWKTYMENRHECPV